MDSIVGYTGFVGSNLLEAKKFDRVYNTKNIQNSYGLSPDLLVYAGIRAEMYLSNKFPEKDMEEIKTAILNITRINPKKLILISTVDVYSNTILTDENTKIDNKYLSPYGKNRLYLEQWVEKNISDYLIVRLPALYGINLKKNFIYDYIHVIPKMLSEEKFSDLKKKEKALENYYVLQDNGFYVCRYLNAIEEITVRHIFKKIGFTALHFTDSRSEFQFYNLKYLWKHIELFIKNDLRKVNLATEPISIAELYYYLEKNHFINEITDNPRKYNVKTNYAEIMQGKNGYIFSKEFILNDINSYICEVKNGKY